MRGPFGSVNAFRDKAVCASHQNNPCHREMGDPSETTQTEKETHGTVRPMHVSLVGSAGTIRTRWGSEPILYYKESFNADHHIKKVRQSVLFQLYLSNHQEVSNIGYTIGKTMAICTICLGIRIFTVVMVGVRSI